MHVDFKITTWERCELPDDLTPEQINDLKDKIRRGVITCWDDLEEETGISHTETLLDVEEYMLPEENGGCPTVEFYLEKGSLSVATN